MGAKTWMLVSADGNPRDFLSAQPLLNRDASLVLAKRLFPAASFVEGEDGDLSWTNPDDDEIFVAHFGSVAVVAASEFGIDYPSQLPGHFVEAMPHGRVFLHAMHSVVDWFAFAVWEDGKLKRALSLSPESGILEDIGDRYPFESPYWNGERPVDGDDHDEDNEDEYQQDDDGDGDYPFVFHPLELAEEALAYFFGYVLEGAMADSAFDPEEVPLMTLRRGSR